ncbi:MAG: hypothetical protein IKC72_03045 [Clostridia bacterium]|nr:hypothetical protein [Clostridia bacterium]
MKILKIREGKLKLSLSVDEATKYGLGRDKVISNKDLCATVRRLLKNSLSGTAWEKLLVEGYPKLDGSYEIFVYGECVMEKSERSCALHYYGFERAEHLAFALYVLLKEKSQTKPIGEGTEETCISPAEQVNFIEDGSASQTDSILPQEVYDLFFCGERKNENPERDRLFHRLPPLSLYRMGHRENLGVCFPYILSVMEADGIGAIHLSPMSEFGKELTGISEELLLEHTSCIDVSEVFSEL